MSQIKLFVGDFAIANSAIVKWGAETGAEIKLLHRSSDIEDLINPFSFEKNIYIIKNPNKDMISNLEIIEKNIIKNNYVAICSESIDKRLSFFKNKEIVKCGYIEQSNENKCINIIKNLSGFEDEICQIIYRKTGYILADIENNKGNKVATKVLNIEKIKQEIEKLKLMHDIDEKIAEKIVCKSKIANSWELIDCVFEGRILDAVPLVDGTVIDLTHVMMFIGLLISEARLGMLVASMKNKNPTAILQKVYQMQNNFGYLIEGDEEKKSKLSVHPYRIYKTIEKLKNPKYLNRCVQILKKCEKYNEKIREDIPYQFLIYSLIVDLS